MAYTQWQQQGQKTKSLQRFTLQAMTIRAPLHGTGSASTTCVIEGQDMSMKLQYLIWLRTFLTVSVQTKVSKKITMRRKSGRKKKQSTTG